MLNLAQLNPLAVKLDLGVLATDIRQGPRVGIVTCQVACLVESPASTHLNPGWIRDEAVCRLGSVVEVPSCEARPLQEHLADTANRNKMTVVLGVNKPNSDATGCPNISRFGARRDMGVDYGGD